MAKPRPNIPRKRGFGSKFDAYHFVPPVHKTKAKAKKKATALRNSGKAARVVPVKGGYAVYSRPKSPRLTKEEREMTDTFFDL